MLIAYPEMFAAAYPICEALGDQYVTDEDIDRIKKIPIWFTHAANDPIVLADKHTVATYKRLVQAGAPEVHFSCYQSVTDNTGKYYNPDNTPYEYNGHFSWIPALNNECVLETDSVTLFEWLAKQKMKGC